MKKKFLTFMAFVSVLMMAEAAYAQKTYLPILEIGKEWTYTNYAVNGDLHGPAELWNWKAVDTVEEDGHQVFILKLENSNSGVASEDFRTSKYYEGNGVLWYFSLEYIEYVPMIDFNLEVGDMVDDWYEVIWKGPVDIEGVERCVIALQVPGGKKVYYWVEGIGDVDDVYVTPMIAVVGERTRMTECRMGDKCLFDYSRMDEYMSGIDLSGVKSLSGEEESAPIYDILGRRITEPVSGQLYIQDGKKHIAR